jgi:hypothetical protein
VLVEPVQGGVVELQEGQAQLGDDEVFVVAAVADLRLPRDPREVVTGQLVGRPDRGPLTSRSPS